ncbi:DUF2382 domain-containing protein [Allosphingosinicella deserti]|uniref:DUF2382 domain-containing protein n=1 Tax=Allosphingosinicella deserti TaxID=2116704 RepID=A0A2P7QJD5_9SPHN|nr:DUF2382 domain-containing protein [Sphingomonas deserti]PSJ38074.1 hypothetical protein C7I55_20535 [Sphingomonas deserti]
MTNEQDRYRPTGASGRSANIGSGRVIEEQIIPLVEESLAIERRTVETGTVRVRTVLQTREEVARADIYRQAVSIEHVPINREISEVPEPWEDGEVLVIPVVEEVLVVEKRLMLREEIRVTRARQVDKVEQPVALRSMEAVVERQSRAGAKV